MKHIAKLSVFVLLLVGSTTVVQAEQVSENIAATSKNADSELNYRTAPICHINQAGVKVCY